MLAFAGGVTLAIRRYAPDEGRDRSALRWVILQGDRIERGFDLGVVRRAQRVAEDAE